METQSKLTSSEIPPSEQLRSVQLNLLIDFLTLAPVIAIAVLSQSMLLFTDIFDYAKGITCLLYTSDAADE